MWNTSEIPENKRNEMDAILLEDYDDLRVDLEAQGDIEDLNHPLILDGQGVLRWKSDPLMCHMTDLRVIDLNRSALLSQKDQRKLYKQLGYSLCGYAEMFGSTAQVQGWAN